MKKLIFFLLLPVFAWGQPYRTLMVKTNGELASPTNFWDVNASSILDALDLSSDSVTTNDARRLQFTNPTNQFIGVFTGNGNGLTNLSLVAILAAFPSGVSNYDTRALSFTNPANQLVGVFSGNGANLTNLPIPSGLLSNYYVLPVVLNDSLSLSNGNIGFTNYSGTATLYMSSPNGGGLGSIAFNGAYTFVGSGGIQANQFVGSGTGLTSVPANQLSGTVPMANLDARVVTNANATLSGNQLTTGDGGRGIRTTNLTASVLGLSGGVPYSATAAQVAALFPGAVLTNGYTAAVLLKGSLFGLTNASGANGAFLTWDGSTGMFTNNGPVGFSGALTIGGASTVVGNMTFQNIVGSRFLALNGAKIVQAGGDSAALAISLSDETGSGSAVFSTSPTFQTAITVTGPATSTNTTVANTYAVMDGSRTTAGNVLDYTTNGVSKFSVTTAGVLSIAGILSAPTANISSYVQFSDTMIQGLGANVMSFKISTTTAAPTIWFGPTANWVVASFSTNNGRSLLTLNSSVALTNGGITISQLTAIPTNAIPASSSGNTNWTLCNLTNTIGGGGPTFVATNIATAGSFLLARPALTVTTYP